MIKKRVVNLFLSIKLKNVIIWFVSKVVDKWKEALAAFFASIGIAFIVNLNKDIKDYMTVYMNSITNPNLIVNIMRRASVDGDLLLLMPYYDLTKKKQYIAAAYQSSKQIYVRLFDVSSDFPIAYNSALPIKQEFLYKTDVVSPGVYFPQKLLLSRQENIDPKLKMSNENADSKNYLSSLSGYFGFSDVGLKGNIMLFSVYLSSSAREREIRIFIYDPKDNQTYQVYQTLWKGLEVQEPMMSGNIDNNNDVRDWLLAKLKQVKSDWLPPYNDDYVRYKSERIQNDSARWFELNGLNTTVGNIQTVEATDNEHEIDNDLCHIKVGDVVYFINYRVGVDATNTKTKKTYVLYRASQFTDGPWNLVEGNNYIWVGFSLKRKVEKENIFRVLGFEKHSKLDIVEFVAADFVTVESDKQDLMSHYSTSQDDDDLIYDVDDPDDIDDQTYRGVLSDFDLNKNMPKIAQGKEENINLVYKNNRLSINGLEVVGIERILKTRGGRDISYKDEFNESVDCKGKDN